MSQRRRSTQADVARLAGVARSTVSMALRNHPSIPEDTKAQIRRAAETLCYQPDPMLSALASYRSELRPAIYHGTLAWLVNDEPPFQWSSVGMFRQYHEGCQSQAAKYGYRVETFDLGPKDVSSARYARIFQSRNIEGILLCPQPRPYTVVDFPLEDFAVVTFGYSAVSPKLHTVAPMQAEAVRETMKRLYALGYGRIGYVFSGTTDARTNHNFLSGYLVERHLHGGATIPPIDESGLTADAFRAWFGTHRPDAIITGSPYLLRFLAKAGYRVPEDVGVACSSVLFETDPMSGVCEDSFHIGEAAVDFLVGMLQKGIRGIPAKPRSILIPGIWVPGTTLARR